MANRVAIIIPVFNESANLKIFLPRLLAIAQEVEADVIAINDASTDDSVAVLESFSVTTLTQFTQMGYGTTVQTGYKYTYRTGYEYVIQVDGDGQHDPRFIPRILQCLQNNEADVIIGSRFLRVTEEEFLPFDTLYTGTFLRRIGIQMFRLALRIFSFRYITDPTSGFIGYNRSALRFVCGKSFPFDYPDADMILTLINNHFRLMEVPVYMYHNRISGFLHRGCKPLWYIFKVSLSLVIATLRSKEA